LLTRPFGHNKRLKPEEEKQRARFERNTSSERQQLDYGKANRKLKFKYLKIPRQCPLVFFIKADIKNNKSASSSGST
jgi:hypothetical protein